MDKKQLYGKIFDIQRMSLHDGPGIRTTIFFKGCSMHCFWCHNPESISSSVDIQFYNDKCIQCQQCRAVCENECHVFDPATDRHIFSREHCTLCGKCTEVCPSGSLVKTGYEISVEKLLAIVTRDRPFYENSGGGITASGGEPLLQKDFIKELFRQLKQQQIHTAIETALNIPSNFLQEVIPYTDLFLTDMKHPDSEMHKKVTGASDKLIMENYKILDSCGKDYIIRIPIIPGINDSPELMHEFSDRISDLKNPLYTELMPYHEFGLKKYDSLSKDRSKLYGISPPAKEELLKLANCFHHTAVHFRDGANTIIIKEGKLCKEKTN